MINSRLNPQDHDKRLAPFEHAVNSAEARARIVWLTLTSLSAYVLVAFLATSHEDILLRSRQKLPILQVELPLEAFALIGPCLLWLVHLMTLVNVLYIKDALGNYCGALQVIDSTNARSASWSRIASGIFIRGPGLPVPTVLRGAQWVLETITVWLAPPLIILFCQLRFLPYHDPTITWVHRTFLSLDVICVAIAAVAALRYIAKPPARRQKVEDLLPLMLGAAVLLGVCCLSFLVFQHRQDEAWNPLSRCGQVPCVIKRVFVDDFRSTRSPLLRRDIYAPASQAVTEQAASLADRSYSISLRSRDLEGANLQGGRFYKADFRGANLRGANMRDMDLREALFGCFHAPRLDECTNLQFADLSDSLMQGADFRSVEAQGANFSTWESYGAQLQRANFAFARLSGAYFYGDLSGAILDNAYLSGAHLSGDLTASFLSHAYLSYADLSDALLIGTHLDEAHLEGASLKNARLFRIQGTPALTSELEKDTSLTVDCRNIKLGKLTSTGYEIFLNDMRKVPTTIDRPSYDYSHLDPARVPSGADSSIADLPTWTKQCTNYDPSKQDADLLRQLLQAFCTTESDFIFDDIDRVAMLPLKDHFGRLYTRDLFAAAEDPTDDASGSAPPHERELVGDFYRMVFKSGECAGFLGGLRANRAMATKQGLFQRIWESARASGIDEAAIVGALGPCNDCKRDDNKIPTTQK